MKCPNCGYELTNDELFCEVCGMRVNFKTVSQGLKQTKQNQLTKSTTFYSFFDWSVYWRNVYVQNYEYWSYLICEQINTGKFDNPLMVCIHQFHSLEDMRCAYINVCTTGRELGYGMPADYIYMNEDDNQWYVLMTCSDLPLVLSVADCYHAEVMSWADCFISIPPMPINVGKSFDPTSYNPSTAPVKVKRIVKNIKEVAKKHLTLKGVKCLQDVNAKGTYKTTWQCHKCMTTITTIQEDAGFIRGYGDRQLRQGPCAMGGDHDWHELTVGEWID